MLSFKKTVLAALVFPVLLESACIPRPTAMAEIIGSACYACIFPLRIAGIEIVPGIIPDVQSTISSPICVCSNPFPRIGIPVSFFEPSRLTESVTDAWCFPTMGFGMPLGMGLNGGTKDRPEEGDTARTFFQAHYFIYPLFAMLELLTDFVCLDAASFDLAYLTEVDPMWNDDALTALITPEALLFNNPVMNLACIADSLASQVFTPLDPLFWCKGSWGNAYPLTGNVTANNFVEDAASASASMIYKLHRELILWGSYGQVGLCGRFPAPIWRKSSYRLQMVEPIPHPIATTIGQSGMIWTGLKNTPGLGDNFGFLLFKKRDCCAF